MKYISKIITQANDVWISEHRWMWARKLNKLGSSTPERQPLKKGDTSSADLDTEQTWFLREYVWPPKCSWHEYLMLLKVVLDLDQ